MTVVIECHVDGAVVRTDADANHVVRIVAREMIVREADDRPRSVRQRPASDTHSATCVVITDVLVTCVSYNRVLLKRQTVNALAMGIFGRKRRWVHHSVTRLDDIDLRIRRDDCPEKREGKANEGSRFHVAVFRTEESLLLLRYQ